MHDLAMIRTRMSKFLPSLLLCFLRWAFPIAAGTSTSFSQAAHKGNEASARGGSGGYGGPPSPAELRAEEENADFRWMIISLALFAILPFVYRSASALYAQVRLLVCLTDNHQRYFAVPSSRWVPLLKKHILYAPLFRVRHNREFRLSSVINCGTLPTRFQSFFLCSYMIGNVVFCTYMIDYASTNTMLSEVRNRTGVMATVNTLPLFLFSGRNNPLVKLLGIPFDSFNLIHRWLGRIVVLEALTHTITHLVYKVMRAGWASVAVSFQGPFIRAGLVAMCAFAILSLHSPSAIRHAFYETFLILHIAGAMVACVGIYYHLYLKEELHHWLKYLIGAVVLWAVERFLRLARLVYGNLGRKMTMATVEVLPGDAVRVTVRMSRPWRFRPGQHLYLYMPRVGLWTSHPFTISWSENELVTKLKSERLALHRQDIITTENAAMSLIIRRRTGFTNKLFERACSSPGGTFTSKAFVEGPYGRVDTLGSYGTVILIAGGVGITHPVPYIKELVSRYADNTVATRRVTLVWVIQTPEHLEWIRPWMTEILAMPKRRDVLKILLFVTRPKSTKEIHSPSATVQMFPGRPNFDTLLSMELEGRTGAAVVTVCGSGSLSDDVRRAVRDKSESVHVDFIEEAFSW